MWRQVAQRDRKQSTHSTHAPRASSPAGPDLPPLVVGALARGAPQVRPLWSTCLRRGPSNTNAQGETSGLEPVRGRGTCGTAQRGAAVKRCQRALANTLAVAWRSTAAAQLSLMHLTKPAFITDPIEYPKPLWMRTTHPPTNAPVGPCGWARAPPGRGRWRRRGRKNRRWPSPGPACGGRARGKGGWAARRCMQESACGMSALWGVCSPA